MSQLVFECHPATDIGKVRKANEDSFDHFETSYGHVFIVCDGMGGHVGGAVASKTAIECIREHLSSHAELNIIQAIHESIKFANTQIFARASSDPSLHGMGTTCVIVILQPDGSAYYGHVGDSRLYLFTDQQLHQITKDHSFVQYLVDTGQITSAEAETHPARNQILKALGTSEHVNPDVSVKPIQPKAGDIFLLCSDGLSGMVSDPEMEKSLMNPYSPATVNELVSMALAAGGKDNITAILARITESPFATTSYSVQGATKPSLPAESVKSGIIEKALSIVPNKIVLAGISVLAVVLLSLGIWRLVGPDHEEKKTKGGKPAQEKPEGKNKKTTTGDSKIQVINKDSAEKVQKAINEKAEKERIAAEKNRKLEAERKKTEALRKEGERIKKEKEKLEEEKRNNQAKSKNTPDNNENKDKGASKNDAKKDK